MEKGLYSNLIRVTLDHRRRLGAALAMVMVSNGLLIANPLLFRQALVSVYGATDTHTFAATRFFADLMGPYAGNLSPWVLLLIFVALVASYFKYRMRVEFVSVSREEERRVRSKLFGRLQSQSMEFYDRHPVGDLMSSLTNDIAAYREVLGPGIMYPLYFLTMVSPALLALYSISPPMATLSLLPVLVLPILVVFVQKRVYNASKGVQEVLGEMSSQVHEHYSGIRIVKGYCSEEEATTLFRGLCKRYYHLSIWLACLRGIFYPCLALFTKAITVLLVVFTGYCAYHAWWQLSSADFVSFMWIQAQIFGPVLMLAWVLPLYQRGAAAYDRLVGLYSEPVEVQDAPGALSAIPSLPSLELRQLSFTYPETTAPVLRNISYTIPYGTFLGITGPVGSGKTTLLRLLNREYAISKESIYVAGRDIHAYSIDALHQVLGVVEQAPFLFSKTVAENVGFGSSAAREDEIEDVARLADLHDSILTFPQRYKTMVGERGVKLSGGQKQRVAIARTLLVDRPILLLDDVFSAVDSGTEERIFAQLRERYHGRTLLLVTHRVPVLAEMDQILYLSEGSIVESGTPQELMAMGGRYAALVELQRFTVGVANE